MARGEGRNDDLGTSITPFSPFFPSYFSYQPFYAYQPYFPPPLVDYSFFYPPAAAFAVPPTPPLDRSPRKLNPTRLETIAEETVDPRTNQLATPTNIPVMSTSPISPLLAPLSPVESAASHSISPKATTSGLFTPSLAAILDAFKKEGEQDTELLKCILNAKAKEDEVSHNRRAIRSE